MSGVHRHAHLPLGPMGQKNRVLHLVDAVTQQPSGPRLNTCIKTVFPRYGDSHVRDKTVVRLSYL